MHQLQCSVFSVHASITGTNKTECEESSTSLNAPCLFKRYKWQTELGSALYSAFSVCVSGPGPGVRIATHAHNSILRNNTNGSRIKNRFSARMRSLRAQSAGKWFSPPTTQLSRMIYVVPVARISLTGDSRARSYFLLSAIYMPTHFNLVTFAREKVLVHICTCL